MKPVICLEPLYPKLSAEQKIERIVDFGFPYVECWGWRDKNIPAILETCDKYGVKVVNINGHQRGSLVAEGSHAELLRDFRESVEIAQRLDCHSVIMLTNALTPSGDVADAFEQIPDERKFRNTVQALQQALAATPEHLTLVLEPLNTRIEHPGYFLTEMPTAAAIVREVGDARLKILCDLYHQAVMGKNLTQIIKDFLPAIGHFHIADVPGRHEPGTGTIDWAALLTLIKNGGYSDYIGFEYWPQENSDESLLRIVELWELVDGV